MRADSLPFSRGASRGSSDPYFLRYSAWWLGAARCRCTCGSCGRTGSFSLVAFACWGLQPSAGGVGPAFRPRRVVRFSVVSAYGGAGYDRARWVALLGWVLPYAIRGDS